MNNYILIVLFQASLFGSFVFVANVIIANHAYIQYFGRWNFTIPLAQTHNGQAFIFMMNLKKLLSGLKPTIIPVDIAFL
ncbi:MAG: hypothetical protein AUJ54_06050 [Ignavibacteria bacterium CG1_02_37_35]|nr:MAG: hypothetical protein AUJ54_06050 [Ignavibacteria bacterium CG1_02_37_35]